MLARLLTGSAAESAGRLEWSAAAPDLAPPATETLYGASPIPRGEPAPADPSRDVERKIVEAYQRGLEEGRAAASRAAESELRARCDQLTRAVEAIASYRSRIRGESERDLVQLAIAIAKRILHREIQADPDALLGVVKAALERVETGEIHRIRLWPGQAEIVRRGLERSGPAIEVTADPALEPGSAIVETSRGRIDAGVEAQLREIERGFTDLLP